jgi:hypothetical protein
LDERKWQNNSRHKEEKVAVTNVPSEEIKIPVPATFKEAEKLSARICKNEEIIRRKAGRKIARIQRLKEEISRLKEDVMKKAGNLIKENEALFPILAEFVNQHKSNLLGGREAGTFRFKNATVEITTCPIKPQFVDNDEDAAGREMIERGLGRFTVVKVKRTEVSDHMPEIEEAGAERTGMGNDHIMRLVPHKPIAEKALEDRLTWQWPGEITEV